MGIKKSNYQSFEDVYPTKFDSTTLFHALLRFEGKIADLKSSFMRHQISSQKYYEEYERLGLKLRKVQQQINIHYPNLKET